MKRTLTIISSEAATIPSLLNQEDWEVYTAKEDEDIIVMIKKEKRFVPPFNETFNEKYSSTYSPN